MQSMQAHGVRHLCRLTKNGGLLAATHKWVGGQQYTTISDDEWGQSDPLSGCEKPHILITGALGQLGKGLAELIRRTYGTTNVIMSDVVKPPRRLWTQYAPYLYLDVLDTSSLEAAVVNYHIDWIIHLSAVLSAVGEENVPLALRINCQGVQNILEVAKQHKARVFVPSTIGAFGPTTPAVLTPDITVQRPRTIYGVSKVYAELLGEYMHGKFGLDFRSLRFPGVISATKPGGGTTDYAIKIFYDAVAGKKHNCYLKPNTALPMMYEEDCLRSVMQFLEASERKLTKRTYNVTGMSFTPDGIATAIRKYIPSFEIEYNICPVRQAIADSWPDSLDDSGANKDWGWSARYDIDNMVMKMLQLVGEQQQQVGSAGQLAVGQPSARIVDKPEPMLEMDGIISA